MAGRIICSLISLGCAILFYSIGIYSNNKQEPMHFYSGTEVKSSQITDIRSYNLENAKMWKKYSLWYFSSTIACMMNSKLCFILLMLSCTVGIYILNKTYQKIYEKYKKEHE